jgi:hypothetical protein
MSTPDFIRVLARHDPSGCSTGSPSVSKSDRRGVVDRVREIVTHDLSGLRFGQDSEVLWADLAVSIWDCLTPSCP